MLPPLAPPVAQPGQAAAAQAVNPAPLPQNKVVPSKQNPYEYHSWLKDSYEKARDVDQSFVGWVVFIPKALFGGLGDLFVNLAKLILNTAHQVKVFLVGEMPDVSKYSISQMKSLPLSAKSPSSAAPQGEERAPEASPADELPEELTLSEKVVQAVTSTNDHVGKVGEGLRESVKNSPGLGSSFCFASGVIVSALFSPELATGLGLGLAISTSVRYFRSHPLSRAPEAAS